MAASAHFQSLACPEQAFEEDPAAGKGGKGLQPNPMLLGMTPEQYMLKQVASVRAGDLEQALLILPFSDALRLLAYFCTWLERGAQVRALPANSFVLVPAMCCTSTLQCPTHLEVAWEEPLCNAESGRPR